MRWCFCPFAVFLVFAVEVLAFRLVEAEGRVRKAKVSPRKDPVSQRLCCLLRLGPWVYPGHQETSLPLAVRERRAPG